MLITTKDRAHILYKGWGPKSARPVLAHHGSPPNFEDGTAQMLVWMGQRNRAMAHENRSHRDHYAVDIAAVEHLPASQQGGAS